MSSPEQATSSTSSVSNIQLITDAFEKYAKITGKDLSKDPFSAALDQSDSPEAILELLQEREKAFREYRQGSRRLITCLSPVVNVLQAFSGVFGETIGMVGHAPHHIQSGLFTFFHLFLSGPFPTCKGSLHWDRYPPRRKSLDYTLQPTSL
jgi:hypothetical protein